MRRDPDPDFLGMAGEVFDYGHDYESSDFWFGQDRFAPKDAAVGKDHRENTHSHS